MYTYIDTPYTKKSTARAPITKTSTVQNLWRRLAQLKISNEKKHNSMHLDEKKHNSMRSDEK